MKECLGEERSYAFLSGPSFAREICEGVATAVVIASEDFLLADDLADMLMDMGYVAPKENTKDAIYVRFKDCRGLSMANILLHNKIPKVCFDLCKSFILKRKF